jgi:signal transduction histidine kinase
MHNPTKDVVRLQERLKNLFTPNCLTENRAKRNVLRVFITTLSIFLMPLFANAQDDEKLLHNLHTALSTTSNDTIRMDIYRQFGFYFQKGKVDSSLYYHQLQLELAKKLNFKLWEADAYQQIGYSYTWQNNLSASFQAYATALKIAEDPKSAENDWGYEEFSFSKSHEEARLSIIGMVYYELAGLYNLSRSHDDELYYLMEGLKIGIQLNNTKILALCYRDIGVNLMARNEPDSALLYYQKSLHYYQNSQYQENLGQLYYLIGDYHLNNQAYDSAKSNFHKVIDYSTISNNPLNLEGGYSALGQLYIDTHQYDSALYYSNLSLELAESMNSVAIGDYYTQVATILQLQNRPRESLTYLQRGKLLSDSINDAYIDKLIQFQNIGFEEQLRIQELEASEEKIRNSLKLNTVLGSTFTLLVIVFFLFRNGRNKQRAKEKVEEAYEQLKSTQSQLIQSEKMASLGELTAGIAHEIQNPLNFVNNFSDVNRELTAELKEALEKGELEEAKELAQDISENETKIVQHGQRADSIVKGMLQHSRNSSSEKELTDANALADEYLRLTYHGLRAKDKEFNADFETEFDASIPKINVVPQDIGRVFLNLINNAFYAVSAKAKTTQENGYKPTVRVKTSHRDGDVVIEVSDNGAGIPEEVRDKIFQPFFTTKATGQGTGLGLSLSYDIVTKGHGGELSVSTTRHAGTTFTVKLPMG